MEDADLPIWQVILAFPTPTPHQETDPTATTDPGGHESRGQYSSPQGLPRVGFIWCPALSQERDLQSCVQLARAEPRQNGDGPGPGKTDTERGRWCVQGLRDT